LKDWGDFVRELIAVPIGLVLYVILVAVIFTFCLWFFDKPQDWPYLIPIITAFISLSIACDAAKNISSINGAKILGGIVVVFWIIFVVVDFAGTIQDIISALFGRSNTHDSMDVIMFYVDAALNAKIFAVTSIFAASSVR